MAAVIDFIQTIAILAGYPIVVILTVYCYDKYLEGAEGDVDKPPRYKICPSDNNRREGYTLKVRESDYLPRTGKLYYRYTTYAKRETLKEIKQLLIHLENANIYLDVSSELKTK